MWLEWKRNLSAKTGNYHRAWQPWASRISKTSVTPVVTTVYGHVFPFWIEWKKQAVSMRYVWAPWTERISKTSAAPAVAELVQTRITLSIGIKP